MTALVFAVITATYLPAWVSSLGPYTTAMALLQWDTGAASVVAAAQDSRTINNLSFVLQSLSSLAYILLLFAFFRHADDESTPNPNISVSRMLSVVTKLALTAYGLLVAFNLIRLVLTPYSYFHLRDAALQLKGTPPQLTGMIANAIRAFVSQACLFMGPYIAYNSWPRPDRNPAPGSSSSNQAES